LKKLNLKLKKIETKSPTLTVSTDTKPPIDPADVKKKKKVSDTLNIGKSEKQKRKSFISKDDFFVNNATKQVSCYLANNSILFIIFMC